MVLNEVQTLSIAAGVPIQPDFVLSLVLPSGKQKMVPDDKKIHLKDGDEFWAMDSERRTGDLLPPHLVEQQAPEGDLMTYDPTTNGG